MVKTHDKSRLSLLTIENIRDATDIILQIVETGTYFTDGKKCFLCEVVKSWEYHEVATEKKLADELVKVNGENRRLHVKITKLENQLKKARGTQ